MSLIWVEERPVSWGEFSEFVRRDTERGQVWCGRSPTGTLAFAKIPEHTAAFHRAYRTFCALGNRVGLARCLAVDTTHRALLISDAGPLPTLEQMQLSTFTDQLWGSLGRLHELEIAADSMDTQTAISARWARLRRTMGTLLSSALCDWMDQHVSALQRQPRGWVHRDVRPVNVGVREGTVTLFDFGQSRADFILFDAVPFFTGDWPKALCQAMLAQFEDTLGRHLMQDLPVFSVLYLLGSMEQLQRRKTPKEYERVCCRYRHLQTQTTAPLNFDDFLAQIS